MVACLRQAGAEVQVVAPQVDGEANALGVPHPMPQPAGGGAVGSARSGFSPRSIARDWVRLPDPDVAWAKRAASFAIEHGLPNPDWVFVSTPPESALLAGMRIKAATGARMACDFRDGWFNPALYPPRKRIVRRLIERPWARRALGNLDCAFAVDQSVADEIAQIGYDRPITLLPHFDTPYDGPAHSFSCDQVNLVHTGRFTLSDPHRTIGPVLSAFARAHQTTPRLHLHLVGDLSDEEAHQVQQCPAANAITCHGRVTRTQSLAFQAGADALLLRAPDGSAAPPGKFFEYLGFDTPLILIGSPVWQAGMDWTPPPAHVQMEAIARGEPLSRPVYKPVSFDTATARVMDALQAAGPEADERGSTSTTNATDSTP